MAGKKVNNWCLTSEKARGKLRWAIRRWVVNADGKKCLERLPVKKYARIKDDPEELAKLVLRLNHDTPDAERVRVKVRLRHAYIGEPLLDEYKEFLRARIPSDEGANTEFSYLYRHFLVFFIQSLGLPSPLEWHAVHETKWANYLLGDKAPASAKSKRDVVNAANRFIGWLHKKRPEEVPPLEFSPLSKARLKKVEAQRELDKQIHETKFIKNEDWAIIQKSLPENIAPYIRLAYAYGLRRAELLGLQQGDTKKGHLSVERQMIKLGKFGPLKGRSKRSVPHWFSTAAESYKWIEQTKTCVMHPRTFSDYWDTYITALMDRKGGEGDENKRLGTRYTLHDLRHTFITRALRENDRNARDVQLAAGHKHLSTTMGYAHDDRDLSDDVFIPDQAS